MVKRLQETVDPDNVYGQLNSGSVKLIKVSSAEDKQKQNKFNRNESIRQNKRLTINEANSHNYKKWTELFNDFIDTIGVSVSWDPDKKEFYLEDLQGTLSFDDDYYKKETQVVERLYSLAEDYIAQDLDEESDEYGLTEFDEFDIDPRYLDNWCVWYEDFDLDAKDPEYIKTGKKFIKDHEAEFEWTDLFCNHSDDVDLSYLKKK